MACGSCPLGAGWWPLFCSTGFGGMGEGPGQPILVPVAACGRTSPCACAHGALICRHGAHSTVGRLLRRGGHPRSAAPLLQDRTVDAPGRQGTAVISPCAACPLPSPSALRRPPPCSPWRTSVGVLYYAAIVPCVLFRHYRLRVVWLRGVRRPPPSSSRCPTYPVTLFQCIGIGVLALLSIPFKPDARRPRPGRQVLPQPCGAGCWRGVGHRADLPGVKLGTRYYDC